MPPKFLIEKAPEGLLSIATGDLPLDITPPNGPGVYKVHALSDSNTEVTVTTTTAPVLMSAPVVGGSGLIGSVMGATPGVWGDAALVTGQWLADGVPIAGATGVSLTLSDAQDGAVLSYLETAVNGAGSTSAESNTLPVRFEAPVVTGALFDEIFDLGQGYGEVPTAQVFEGAGLRYAAVGGNALINAAIGLVQIPTDAPQEGAVVSVTASNSGGSATAAFQVTVEEDPGTVSQVTEIQADGVVFRFDRTVEAGTFVNGDWFVIANGASLIEALPASEQVSTSGYITGTGAMSAATGANRWINGLELEMSFGDAQGFDSYIRDEGAGARSYVGTRNWDPGATGQVLGLAAGQQIVKAVSVAQDPANYSGAVSDLKNPLSKLVTLTVLASVPPAGAFRPPLKGWDGVTFYTESMIDWSRLPSEDVSTLMPGGDPDDMASPFPFWLDGGLGDKAAQSTAVDQSHGTADALGRQVGLNLMWLCGLTPLGEKTPHGLDMIQAGLDGLLTRAERPGGYAGQGLVPAGAFAAHMLDRSELSALASAVPSGPGDLDTLGQEQHQVFALPQSAIDTPVEPNLTDPAVHYGQDYQAEQLGLPEWDALDPANTPESPALEPVPEPMPPFSGAALAVSYGADPAYAGPTTGDFYVATDGDDSNAGTSAAAPFATVQAAIDAADAAGGAQVIVLRGGTYRQSATLTGTTADITFTRYGTEVPRMSASEPLTGWTQCGAGDAVEVGANFASIYKTTIALADLDHGGRHLLNLYEDGARCNIAQDRAIDTNAHATLDDKTWHNGTFNLAGGSGTAIQSITDTAVMANYTQAQALDLIVGLYYGDNRAGETTFSAFDEVTDTGTLTNQALLEHQSGSAGHRYALINSPQALAQGRWACSSDANGTTATVYFWPSDPANLAANIEYTKRSFVMDTGDAQGDITARGVDFVRAALDTTAGGGLCFGNETSASAPKAGRVTLEHCIIGECAGFGYGPMYLRNVAGGVRMQNVTFRETTTHACQLTNCPDSRADQMDFRKVGGTTMRVFATIGFMFTHSNADDVARNTHANLMTVYLGCDRFLTWGFRVRNNFGYFTWQETSNVLVAFSDVPATGVTDDDRAIADQNVPPGSGLGGSDGSGAPEGGSTTTYFFNNATRPSRAGGAVNSVSTGSNNPGGVYEGRNNIIHGLSDVSGYWSSTANNVYTALDSETQQPLNLSATDAYQNVLNMYVDPYNGDYTPRADAITRGRTGADISGLITAAQTLFPNFTEWDKDMDGRQFAAIAPPTGPQLVLPAAPVETVYPYAPLAFANDTWMELQPQIGWQDANEFTMAHRFNFSDDSASIYLGADALNTYLIILATSTPMLRLKVNRQDGSTAHFSDTVLTGWAEGQDHSIVWTATATGVQVWADGSLLVNATYADLGPLQAPIRINSASDDGLYAHNFELEAVWYSTAGSVPAATAAAALFDNSASTTIYLPTQAMLDGDAVGGVAPQFFEARAKAWPKREGWQGPHTAVALYQGAEIGRADRVRALQGLVPGALAMHLVPQVWSVSGADPLRNYLDRVMSWFAQHYDAGTADFTNLTKWGVNLETAVSAAEYAFYRDVILPQISPWSGVPEVPLPPQVVYNGAGALVVTPAGFAAGNNSPVTARNMRYRLHGASQWTVVTDIGAQALISGVGSGDSYEVQVQHVNALGAGGWSYNAPLMGGPAAGPLRASGII